MHNGPLGVRVVTWLLAPCQATRTGCRRAVGPLPSAQTEAGQDTKEGSDDVVSAYGGSEQLRTIDSEGDDNACTSDVRLSCDERPGIYQGDDRCLKVAREIFSRFCVQA